MPSWTFVIELNSPPKSFLSRIDSYVMFRHRIFLGGALRNPPAMLDAAASEFPRLLERISMALNAAVQMEPIKRS